MNTIERTLITIDVNGKERLQKGIEIDREIFGGRLTADGTGIHIRGSLEDAATILNLIRDTATDGLKQLANLEPTDAAHEPLPGMKSDGLRIRMAIPENPLVDGTEIGALLRVPDTAFEAWAEDEEGGKALQLRIMPQQWLNSFQIMAAMGDALADMSAKALRIAESLSPDNDDALD